MNKEKAWVKPLIYVAIALVIAVNSFILGFVARGCTRGGNSSYDWAYRTILNNYYGEFDGNNAEVTSLKALAALLDPYSEYYTAEEYKRITAENEGKKSGVGINYNFVAGEGMKIIAVTGNSPAYAAGIRTGDVITAASAGDTRTEFLTVDDATSFFTARADNEAFTLHSAEKDFSVKKTDFTASYTFMATNKLSWEFVTSGDGSGLALIENAKDTIPYLPDGTAYIRLNQFYGTAADEFGKLVEKFNAKNCTSLILDLRNDGGGYVSVMQDIAGYFTSSLGQKKCVAMTAKYKDNKNEVYFCKDHSGKSLISNDVKVSVLANANTASASEALIGALVSYGFLEYKNIFLSDFSQEYLDYVGEGAKTKRSYGKGIMQSTFYNYSTGEALKLTTAKIFWQNGKCIHDVGLTEADGCRLAPAKWTATKGDEELKYVVDNYLK